LFSIASSTRCGGKRERKGACSKCRKEEGTKRTASCSWFPEVETGGRGKREKRRKKKRVGGQKPTTGKKKKKGRKRERDDEMNGNIPFSRLDQRVGRREEKKGKKPI